ncbi:MAG: 6-phosphogluconolactonase [Proteobacteria bacterium]|nr:6-phosphogluconolactonase [Pseudomonadota bacterium]
MNETISPLALPGFVRQRLFDADAAMARALAAAVADALRSGLAGRGCASLAVSGGRSPIPFLEALSAETLDWSRVVVTLVDERWVAPDSADSNEALVRRHLLLGHAAAARFVPLKTPAPSPEAGVAAALALRAELPQPFDAVVLGMGEDGHTASLFPDAAGLAEALDMTGGSTLTCIHPPAAPHARITLTLAGLLDTQRLFLQAGGAKKRAVLERTASQGDPLLLPIAAVLQQRKVVPELFFCA